MTELKELSQLCEAQFRNPDVGIIEIPTISGGSDANPAHRRGRRAGVPSGGDGLPPGESHIFEIGGRDVSTYGGMIREYAQHEGAAAVADLGAGADAVSVGPLAGPRDADQLRDRTAFDRRLEEPHRGPGPVGAGRVPDPPDGDLMRLSQGDTPKRKALALFETVAATERSLHRRPLVHRADDPWHTSSKNRSTRT